MSDIFDPQEQSISDDGWGTSLYAPVTDLLAKEETHIKQSPQSLVFENQDILAVVFENFTIDFDSPLFKVNQRDLFNAALACIACTDPAMNTLWGNMDSFVPLLRLLPSCKVINDKYVISGMISEQDWVQFDAYSRRIRSFTLKHDATIASHVFIQLMEHHPSPLLPALQHLNFPIFDNDVQMDHSAPAFICLSSPSLKYMKITHFRSAANYILEPFLSVAAQKHSSLKRMYLHGRLCSVQSLFFIPKFKDLRSLFLYTESNITPELLERIGNLMYLSEMTIKMTYYPETVDLARQGKKPIIKGLKFQGLKSLVIFGCPPAMIQFFDCMEPSNLETINLECEKHPSLSDLSEAWTECFSWIAAARKLTSLTIVEQSSMGLPATLLVPLFRLTQLQCLKIDVSSSGLTSSDLLQIAHAFPNLVTLRLPPDPTVKAPSLTALRALSKLCPHLEEVHIPIDARKVPPMPSFQFHALKHLYLNTTSSGWSSSHIIEVSLYLDFTFPHAQVAGYGNNGGGNGHEEWKGVQQQLQAFQTVRRGVVLAHTHMEELLSLEEEISQEVILESLSVSGNKKSDPETIAKPQVADSTSQKPLTRRKKHF